MNFKQSRVFRAKRLIDFVTIISMLPARHSFIIRLNSSALSALDFSRKLIAVQILLRILTVAFFFTASVYKFICFFVNLVTYYRFVMFRTKILIIFAVSVIAEGSLINTSTGNPLVFA